MKACEYCENDLNAKTPQYGCNYCWTIVQDEISSLRKSNGQMKLENTKLSSQIAELIKALQFYCHPNLGSVGSTARQAYIKWQEEQKS